MKTDIASLTFPKLTEYISENGLPPYRAEQIFRWIARGASDFSDMTDLSLSLRSFLSENAVLPALIPEKTLRDPDGTVKYLFRLTDGEHIETVLMKYEHGNSVCISSQVGCRMNCAFCASSLCGLKRSLTAGEMLAQVAYANKDSGVDSVVVMGIGEPMDNFDNLIIFLKNLSDPHGMAMSLRHCSVSTCGIVPGIDALSQYHLQLTLSISLHAPDDDTRSRLMPVNKRWGVNELISACRRYADKTGRRISFEYTMIKDVNDKPEHAAKLAALLRGLPAHINLIPANFVKERGLYPSPPENIRRFQSLLTQKKMTVTVRRTLGGKINAACGQLRHNSENPE